MSNDADDQEMETIEAPPGTPPIVVDLRRRGGAMRKPNPAKAVLPRPEGLTAIYIVAGEMPRIAKEAMNALTGAGIFQRGGLLVRIARLGEATEIDGIRRKAGSIVVTPITKDYLQLLLARSAAFHKFDARTQSWRRTDPPPTCAAALLSMVGEWTFPELVGVVSAPTLRSNGTLLAAAGFDAATGLYLATDYDFGVIKAAPTRAEAQDALDALYDMLSEFVFITPEHRSAALAATVAAGVRHALGIAPMYGFSAYKAGTGKTTLAQAISQLWLGQDAPVMPLGDDEAEVRKAVLAALIAAEPIMLIDNIERPVSSATLCAVLTAEKYTDRVLGLSQRATAPTACTWLATGNGLQFQGDLTSRVIVATMDPQLERPEERTFRRNLADFIAANRATLVRAALSIPLAYIAAGRPSVAGPASRFRGWDAFVRRPLLWLGVPDPVATQAEVRDGDDERANLVALILAWRATFGDSKTTVAEAIAAASAVGMSENAVLKDALSAIADDRKGGINSRVLGRYLVRHIRRIEGGLRFEDAGQDLISCRRRFRVTSVSSVISVCLNDAGKTGSANSMGSVGRNAENADNAGGYGEEDVF